MYTIKYQPVEYTALLIAVILLSACLMSTGVIVCRAEDEPTDPPAVADEETEEDTTDGTSTEDDSSGENEDDNADEQVKDAEDVPPEGVHRRRPRSAQMEREYKQRVARDDPFLNQPQTDPNLLTENIYIPSDWLYLLDVEDISRYMVQDESGLVVGYETVVIELASDAVLGDYLHQTVRGEGLRERLVDLWMFADTLKPRSKIVRTPLGDNTLPVDIAVGDGAAVGKLYDNMSIVDVDYFFDRVSITHREKGISVLHTMRQLPFSYDVDSLPVLVRQLEYTHGEWPFEAAISHPERQKNMAIIIGKPERVRDVYSAEGTAYRCYEVTVSMAGNERKYWVERVLPHRLVKYTDGVYTYTLMEYMERK